ncbi:hypothetical protein QNM99_17485 [Pseudomonas sp. PCH446]
MPGTLQVALLKEGPLRGRGYSLNDRLHYLHGLMHWFSKPFILMLLVSPVLYWYFGIAGFYAKPADFLAFGMPALIAFWGYGTWVTARRTLPVFTEVTQIVASLAVTATIASAMIRPFGRPFKVTAKGLDRTRTLIHWKLFGFFLALILFSQVGAFIAIATAAAFDGNMLFNLCWTVVALIYNLATLVACVDRPRLHGEERFPFDEATGLRLGTKTFAGRLVDISVSGSACLAAWPPRSSRVCMGKCGSARWVGSGWRSCATRAPIAWGCVLSTLMRGSASALSPGCSVMPASMWPARPSRPWPLAPCCAVRCWGAAYAAVILPEVQDPVL